MTELDRELLTIECNHLMHTYDLSYMQLVKYIRKHYGFNVSKTTVYRWLNT